LWRGRRLRDGQRRAELERRTVAAALRHAQREGDFAQWPPSLEPPSNPQSPIRTQWCHGAPGMVTSLAPIATGDETLTDVLIAGGELTWRAGPLTKGAGLCHGTAGNGYAFLKLFERTHDELWLHRARSFATHAIEQVQKATREHRQGHHTLWTGDLGTAAYLQSCLTQTADMPTLDNA
jgi:lantibiotic modifying enzyme